MRPSARPRLTAAQQYLNLAAAPVKPLGGTLRPDGFTWRCEVSPTPLSRVYRIRIDYRQGSTPEVVVEDPDLPALAEGRALPHVYKQSPTRLCLFLPGSGEWHQGLLISRTVIPWAVLWLYYFEEWLASDEWKGGGMHPPSDTKQKACAKRKARSTVPGKITEDGVSCEPSAMAAAPYPEQI